MRLRRWVKKNIDKPIKARCKLKKNGGKDMEAVRVKKHENSYVKTNKKKVLNAINKCNKKYAKAMKELAK